MKQVALAVVLAAFFSGCSLLSVVSDEKNQLAVQYATMKVIERPDVEASRVIELVGKARAYVDDGASVTVATLASAARERLQASSLSMADQILIDAILTRAQERLESEIGDGMLAQEQRLQLLTVLKWVEDAAKHAAL